MSIKPAQVATVMVSREEPGPEKDVRAVTPASEPNVQIQTMPWWQAVGIRILRTYLQNFTGLLTMQLAGVDQALGIPLERFGTDVQVAAALAVGGSTMSLLMNLTEILTRLDISPSYARFRA